MTPRLLVLTDRRQARRPLPEVVAAAVAGGARAVVLREKDLPDPQRHALAARLRAVVEPAGALLITATRPPAADPPGTAARGNGGTGSAAQAGSDTGLAARAGDANGAPGHAGGSNGSADHAVGVNGAPGRARDGTGTAVHLPAGATVPVPRPAIVGRSCHDAAELAEASDADYVTVSPVFATASKPGYGPALGTDGLRRLVAAAPVPVYALGGVTMRTAAACRAAGAYGIAVQGAVMRADDPAATMRALLAAVDD